MEIFLKILHYMPWLFGAGAILWLFKSVFVVVRGDEVATLERKYIGKKMPQGRIIALNNEVGLQARTLNPGLHILIPFIYAVKRCSLIVIESTKIAVIESVDGGSIPPGKIFAQVVPGHNSFQDGEAFLKNGGQKGPQIEIVPPGSYRINPSLFKLQLCDAVRIEKGQIGVVIAQDGVDLDNGRLLAKKVPGHNCFQSGEAFLKNGGQKGPQVEILLPGTWRINLRLFQVSIQNAVVISSEQVGLITAKDGQPLPAGEFVAKSVEGHSDFQDGQAFLDNGGQRGSQLDVLKPGTYYVNSLLFDVQPDSVAVVERGQVAVVVSNVGKEPTLDMTNRLVSSQVGENGTKEEAREKYVVPSGYRGIQEEVAGPGRYYLNRRAYIPYIIETTNITIDWDNDDDTRFNALQVISNDGFPIDVSVKVVVRVRPDQAPYMVAKVGSIDNLVQHVIHPMIDSSFRNQASMASAMSFLQTRTEEQAKAEERARADLEKYHVECVSVLICQIKLPQDLMDTQTKKIIAEQQKAMYSMEQESQKSRVEMEKTRATADQQGTLVAAEIAVQVATQKKIETITAAEGKAAATELEGKGEGNKIKAIGDGEAAKILAIGNATAEAYTKQNQAVGKEGVIAIEVVKQVMSQISAGKIKVIPDILITGGRSAGEGLMASLIKIIPGLDLNKLLSIKSDEPEVPTPAPTEGTPNKPFKR